MNDVAYGGNLGYLKRVARELQGVVCRVERGAERHNFNAISDDTKLTWIEMPTNPTLRVIDIPVMVSIMHRHPSRPIVHIGSFSPMQSSLIFGADLILHSLTKYINGHSDIVTGTAIVPPHQTQLLERL